MITDKNSVKSTYTHEEHKISVVIPAYNAEESICKALESISKQATKEIEIVVVDDGSVDSTREKVIEFIGENPVVDISYYYQENTGSGAARNLGISKARGEYIAFVDSDDFVPLGGYTAMYYTADKWSCDVVIGSYMRKIEDGKWYVPDYIKEACEKYDGINCANNYEIAIKDPSLCNRLYRREFLQKNNIRFSSERYGEDLVFNLDTVRCAERIYTTDAITYYCSKNDKAAFWSYKNDASSIRSIKTYCCFFDGIGDIYAEMVYVSTLAEYLLQSIKTISDRAERAEFFESFKEILSLYSGNKKYELLFGMILGMELEFVLSNRVNLYSICEQLSYVNAPKTHNATDYFDGEDQKEIVLKQFAKGQIGLRHIVKYFIAWLKFKLNRR